MRALVGNEPETQVYEIDAITTRLVFVQAVMLRKYFIYQSEI